MGRGSDGRVEGLKPLSKKERWTERDARKVLELVDESGVGLAELERRTGIGPWRVREWRKKLGWNGSGEQPRFVPVRLVRGGSETSPWGGGAVTIELGRGVRICVEAGYDPRKLAELVLALERGSC